MREEISKTNNTSSFRRKLLFNSENGFENENTQTARFIYEIYKLCLLL